MKRKQMWNKMAMMCNFLGTVILFSHMNDFNVLISILFVLYLGVQTVICDSILSNYDCIVHVSTALLLCVCKRNDLL